MTAHEFSLQWVKTAVAHDMVHLYKLFCNTLQVHTAKIRKCRATCSSAPNMETEVILSSYSI